MSIIHGTVVDIARIGILLRGAPGAGKSSLALRLIDEPGFGLGQELLHARLVADDQVVLVPSEGGLIASPPPSLAGLLEIRGVGIVRLSHMAQSRLGLVVDLSSNPPPRMPEPHELETVLDGTKMRRMALDAADPAAAAKIRANLF